MFYTLINLGYFSTVTIYTSYNLKPYHNTRAPDLLKNFRNLIHLAFSGFWYVLGLSAILNVGSEAIFKMFLMDEQCIELIQALPQILGVYYLFLKTLVIAYQWYRWFLVENRSIFDHHAIVMHSLSFGIELLLILSFFSCLPVTWFPTLFFLSVCFGYWDGLIANGFIIYERILMNKKLDWELFLAQIYLDLTTALLLSLLLLGVLYVGDEILDAIMFLKASAYIGLKTVYDFFIQPEISNQKLFQCSLFMIQFGLGIGLLTGFIVLPATAWMSLLLFKILKGTSIFVAMPSLIKKALEEVKVKEKEDELLKIADTKNMSIQNYFLFKRDTNKLAKQSIWENASLFNP